MADSESTGAHRQELIATYRARLAVLERQRAAFGEQFVPAYIVLEIDQIKASLSALEAAPGNAIPDSPPIRMLALFAAPLVQRVNGADLPITLLPVLQELDELHAICEELEPPVALAIEPQIATAERIGHTFATHTSFDILHFTGHGGQEKQGVALALEDEVGALRPMPGAELHSLFNGPPCCLAFLSACHSQGLADALLAAGVRHVVAINAADAVLDLAARAFAKRFYPALLAGSTVQRAFEMGLDAVRVNDDLRLLRDPQTLQPVSMQEALKFRLLPENDPVHQQPLADAMPPHGAHAALALGTHQSQRWQRRYLRRAQPRTAPDCCEAACQPLRAYQRHGRHGQNCAGAGRRALAA
jgi:hypothetical protein